jgi:hypothetical protein
MQSVTDGMLTLLLHTHFRSWTAIKRSNHTLRAGAQQFLYLEVPLEETLSMLMISSCTVFVRTAFRMGPIVQANP